MIPLELWPEWADRHVWDMDGGGHFIGAIIRGFEWEDWYVSSNIPMPAGHDWRVPVMRHQPAPAIDLEQFRVAVEAYEFEGECKQLEYCFGPDADKRAAEAQMADAKRLLPLIDGKAGPDMIGDALSAMGNSYPLTGACMQAALDGDQPTKGEGVAGG